MLTRQRLVHLVIILFLGGLPSMAVSVPVDALATGELRGNIIWEDGQPTVGAIVRCLALNSTVSAPTKRISCLFL